MIFFLNSAHQKFATLQTNWDSESRLSHFLV